jgi:type IV secretion system protein VirD4
MSLLSIRWRKAIDPPSLDLGSLARPTLMVLTTLASWVAAQFVWRQTGGPLLPPRALGIVLAGELSPQAIATVAAPLAIFFGLRVARLVDRNVAVVAWALGAPWCLPSLGWLLSREAQIVAWLLPVPWIWLGLWPLGRLRPKPLHRARWASRHDLHLLRVKPAPDGLSPAQGLILGRLGQEWLVVRSQPQQRELGGVLVVGRPRSGKGLLAVSQIVGAWEQHSLVCTDLKGELHAATAGWRARSGNVIVLDPTGVGHRFDPLASRNTEDDLYRAAQDILHVDGEGDGQAFTERAASMLAAIFVAAKREEIPCLPYARELIRLGLRSAGERLDRIDPLLCQQLLGDAIADADWENRFLTGSWQTLVSRTWPLLTERVVRTFGGNDFLPADLLGPDPISVYVRLSERDMRGLKPLLKLVWETLLNELVAHHDRTGGQGCHPVLLLLDEAARFAIPSLPEYAATVPGRGISLWVALQSLSQLEGVYGRAGALALREALESHVFYRPSDLATAEFLEQRLGEVSAYAHSVSVRPGEVGSSEGRSERPIPLMVAQDVLQLPAETVLVFHRDRPPARAERADWRTVRGLEARYGLPTPPVPSLQPAPGLPDQDRLHINTAKLLMQPPPVVGAATSDTPRPRVNGRQSQLDLFEQW